MCFVDWLQLQFRNGARKYFSGMQGPKGVKQRSADPCDRRLFRLFKGSQVRSIPSNAQDPFS
jgi:hypothetical protein